MRRCLTALLLVTLSGCYQSHERPGDGPATRDAGPAVCRRPEVGEHTFVVEVISAEGDGCPEIGSRTEATLDLSDPPPGCDGVIERDEDGCCLRLEYECLAVENTQVVEGELCGSPPRGEVRVQSVVGIAALTCRVVLRWTAR